MPIAVRQTRPGTGREYALVQHGVTTLLRLGQMPVETDADEETVKRFQEGVEALVAPASDDEAIALLNVLPQDDDSLFGLAWSVLGFIETAPNWPDRTALDDRNWWVTFLRERAERGGRL